MIGLFFAAIAYVRAYVVSRRAANPPGTAGAWLRGLRNNHLALPAATETSNRPRKGEAVVGLSPQPSRSNRRARFLYRSDDHVSAFVRFVLSSSTVGDESCISM